MRPAPSSDTPPSRFSRRPRRFRDNHRLSRSGDPATGDFRDATVIRKFGDVPDDQRAVMPYRFVLLRCLRTRS
jgi:hypothetical protein